MSQSHFQKILSEFFCSRGRCILKSPVAGEETSSSSSLRSYSEGSSKSPCSSPGFSPNDKPMMNQSSPTPLRTTHLQTNAECTTTLRNLFFLKLFSQSSARLYILRHCSHNMYIHHVCRTRLAVA